jgi:hypothetical protein
VFFPAALLLSTGGAVENLGLLAATQKPNKAIAMPTCQNKKLQQNQHNSQICQ